MGKPRMIDVNLLIQAGINPKTLIPFKFENCIDDDDLVDSIKGVISVIDRQDAVNRYEWYNLPKGITSELIERVIYYKGSAIFFYMAENNSFYFLPYGLAGDIDIYGRYLEVTPLPFAGPTATTDDSGNSRPWIKRYTKKVIYEVPIDYIPDINKSCVILRDYVNGIEQNNQPRFKLNEGLVNLESQMIPFLRTALLGLTGISGLRVNSEDEQSNVRAAAQSVKQAALTGSCWIPVVGGLDFQNFDKPNIGDANQFLLSMQAIDNLRLSTLGLKNGGLFEKQGTILQSESDMANSNTDLILQDGLSIRQEFCNIVNKVFNLHIWCEAKEQQDELLMGDNPDNNKLFENENNNDGGDFNE